MNCFSPALKVQCAPSHSYSTLNMWQENRNPHKHKHMSQFELHFLIASRLKFQHSSLSNSAAHWCKHGSTQISCDITHSLRCMRLCKLPDLHHETNHDCNVWRTKLCWCVLIIGSLRVNGTKRFGLKFEMFSIFIQVMEIHKWESLKLGCIFTG